MKNFKVIPRVIAFALVFCFIFTNGAFAQASESKDHFTGKTVVAEQERIIHVLEKYVNVNPDGTFSLTPPKGIISNVGNEKYKSITKQLESTNKLIKSGKFKTTKKGTVYAANDEDLVIQGGGVDSFNTYWWGAVRYASCKEADKIAAGLNKVSTGAWGVATVGGLICLTPAVAAGVGVVIGGLYSAVMYGWMSTDVSYYNSISNGRGIILTLYFAVAYNVQCQ